MRHCLCAPQRSEHGGYHHGLNSDIRGVRDALLRTSVDHQRRVLLVDHALQTNVDQKRQASGATKHEGLEYGDIQAQRSAARSQSCI